MRYAFLRIAKSCGLFNTPLFIHEIKNSNFFATRKKLAFEAHCLELSCKLDCIDFIPSLKWDFLNLILSEIFPNNSSNI